MYLNRVISDAHIGPHHMVIYTINYYINKTISDFQYMRIHIKDLPQEVIDKYSLHCIVKNGYVRVEICKGMYGLKDAVIIT